MVDQTNSALIERMGPRPFLADGGLETHLIFHDGFDLPQFAAFPLLRQPAGRAALERYFRGYLDEAGRLGLGFVLDTATWRASAGWGARMGWSAAEMAAVNREAVEFARALARTAAGPCLVNGVIGPQGDAYRPDVILTAAEAEAYHEAQIGVFAGAGVDLVSGMTLSGVGEAVGIATAARKAGVPAVISFTVETDGRLLGGETVAEAIARTDAETGAYPAWYGVNCAHPEHFTDALGADGAGRIGMIRANASRQSHAELDEASTLDDGDPQELAQGTTDLITRLPGLRVLGGCCGTDLRHVAAIGRRLVS